LRRRTARIVCDEGLGFGPLVHEDEPLIPHDDRLESLLLVAGIDGEAIVL
jgi:hypothetical protein